MTTGTSADVVIVGGGIVGIATGGGRGGIGPGPAMGRIIADLITKGSTSVPIDGLDPGRFAG